MMALLAVVVALTALLIKVRPTEAHPATGEVASDTDLEEVGLAFERST